MLYYATFSLNQTCFQLFREDHRKREETEEYHDRCKQSATCVANIEEQLRTIRDIRRRDGRAGISEN